MGGRCMIMWFLWLQNVEKERSLNVVVAFAFAGKRSGLCADPVHEGVKFESRCCVFTW